MAADQRRSRRGAPRSPRETIQVRAATATTSPESARLLYSIIAWPAAAGTTPPSQRGQSGQPRPDAVRRTTAPLGTITHSSASATSVSRAKAVGVRRRRSDRIGRNRSPAGPAAGGVRLPRCRGPTTPPPAEAPRRTPAPRAASGSFAGLAVILVAIGVAVAFALPEGTDPTRVVTEIVRLQELGEEGPPATLPDAGAGGLTFSGLAAAAGWVVVGSREDRVRRAGRGHGDLGAGRAAGWGRRCSRGRRSARPAAPAARAVAASCSTASTWTDEPRSPGPRTAARRSSPPSGCPARELYDLAGGPPRALITRSGDQVAGGGCRREWHPLTRSPGATMVVRSATRLAVGSFVLVSLLLVVAHTLLK